MLQESIETRMENALQGRVPFKAVWLLAEAFKSEGMTQREMYDLFDRYRAKHHNDVDETKYDAILDSMDYIVGGCSPGEGLFDTQLECG